MKLNKFAHDLTFWSLVVATVILVIISAIVRDYKYMVTNTTGFIIEMVLFSTLPPLVISLVFFKTRNITKKESIIWFLYMVLKFAIFHILFQLAGIYTIFFQIK